MPLKVRDYYPLQIWDGVKVSARGGDAGWHWPLGSLSVCLNHMV